MNRYSEELKRKIVQDFIKENKYAPSRDQIKDLEREAYKKYTDLERYGFSGFDIHKTRFKESFSCEHENANRETIRRDFLVANSNIQNLNDQIEENHLVFNKNFNRISKFLDTLELKLNRLILLNSDSDLFLYGFEETFENVSKINFEKTDAEVNNGYVTLSKNSLQKIGENEYTLKSSISSSGNIIGEGELDNINNLKRLDGSYYKALIESKSIDQIVQLNIFVDFKKETYIGELKITGDSIESNSKSYYNISYNVADESYVPIKPRNKRFSSGENYTAIGKTVKGLKISLFKEKADIIDTLTNKYYFSFALDNIEFTKNIFEKNSESTLYAGPYEVIDENGNALNFNMATIASNTCCITPEKTSVSFFLSKDEINWHSIEYQSNKQSELVKFGNIVDNSILSVKDNTKGMFDFVYDNNLTESTFEEVLFNFEIEPKELEKINLRNVILERNIASEEDLYDSKAGWFFDKEKSNYRCYFYIDSVEGKTIDFGPNSCKIDGKLTSGVVSIDSGYHLFETSSSNWKHIESNLKNAKILEERDDLFPYNHKYLIEGYNYSSSFNGDKVYLGMDKCFASLLKYVPIEVFYMKANNENLDIFTFEEIDGICYFKVKILNSDSSWMREKNNVIIQKQVSDSNKMYVKAIIKSNDEGISPHINSFSIRVI
jgi:hypothetical protein